MPTKKIVANTFFLSVARFVGMLFSFFVILLISRAPSLGAPALGQYNLALSIAAFFIIFSDAGISTIIVRELSKHKCEKNFFSEAFSAKLLFFVFSVFLAVFAALFFSASFESVLFVFLILFSFILDSFSLLFRSVFKAFQEMHLEALVFVLQKISFFLFAALFFLFGWGLFGIATALAASTVISFVFSLVLFFLLPKKPRLKFFVKPKAVFFSNIVFPFVIIGFLDMAVSRLDIFLTSFFLKSNYAVGLYSAPKSLFDAFLIVELSFFAALFPQLSFLFHSDRKRLSHTLSRVMKFLFVFSAPIAIVSIVFSRQILEMFFGTAFASASNVFAIYSVSLAFMLFFSLMFNLLYIANRQKTVVGIFAFTIAINALLSFLLIPRFGIDGTAIATLLSFFSCFLLSFLSVKKIIPISFFFLPRFFVVFAIALAIAFALFLAGFSVIFPVVIVPVVFFLFALDKSDRFFFAAALGVDDWLKKLFLRK